MAVIAILARGAVAGSARRQGVDFDLAGRVGGALSLQSPESMSKTALSLQRVSRAIAIVRGHKVMLDEDLAALYGVPTKALIQAVKRNQSRFPADFMFQLDRTEVVILRSQTVTSRSWGGRRTRPYAFTEQGVAMLSSVLKSARAVRVNIEIMRAFVRLRQMMQEHAQLAAKVDALERKCDARFDVVFDAIRELAHPPARPNRRRIGFSASSRTSGS